MSEVVTPSRRTFLRRGAMGAGAYWMLSLAELNARKEYGSARAPFSPYGPVSPKIDETTGLPLIQLPDGFRYMTYGWTGDVMADGVKTPGLHDGMAVVDEEGTSGRLILVRNHEVGAGDPYLDKPSITYATANSGAGGTTNLIFDSRHGRWAKSWSSLAGTNRNCAGGVTPWGTWITGEETRDAGHGWSFDVGAQKGDPTKLVDMGRFSHEAVMVDPETGYVYETEDDGSTSGFYRFVPNTFGKLKEGGRLYMLRVKGRPNLNLGLAYPLFTKWDVEWVQITDPAATTTRTFAQGSMQGGASFARLEGAWWGDGVGYFIATTGGQVGEGQVFRYDPRDETLTLIFDSPSQAVLENPDNITVTPRGGLLVCEDNSGGTTNTAERLVGITVLGESFIFAVNNINFLGASSTPNNIAKIDYRQNEWAGACYSPDGKWLFANIQTPGVTFAITGPWELGTL